MTSTLNTDPSDEPHRRSGPVGAPASADLRSLEYAAPSPPPESTIPPPLLCSARTASGSPRWAAAHLRQIALGLALSSSGCLVRVYQPMNGLHRPVVVDPQAANFLDVRLTVHCVPEDLLDAQEANTLCQRVGTLFENQGAQVTTTTRLHGGLDDPLGGSADAADEQQPPATALTLELRARELHQSTHPLSWLVCLGTFTLVPAVTESTFAQDVIIRDDTGSVLINESLEGRLVRYFGVGTWVGNQILDLVWRNEEDKLTGDVIHRDLSSDLYRQLSQLLFNAKMQWQVLQQSPSGRAN